MVGYVTFTHKAEVQFLVGKPFLYSIMVMHRNKKILSGDPGSIPGRGPDFEKIE